MISEKMFLKVISTDSIRYKDTIRKKQEYEYFMKGSNSLKKQECFCNLFENKLWKETGGH